MPQNGKRWGPDSGASRTEPLGSLPVNYGGANKTSDLADEAWTVSTAETVDTSAAFAGSPTAFELVSGTPPSGTSLNAGSGVISGTTGAGSAGTYDLVIRASNAYGFDDVSLRIVVS